ncbi:hypothetical protein AMAG_02588 [Allomyces macrogynus ATCC 38327]|uniref:Uncharacterized protein n=1 Tax=Allomyces macrogynus (strain ATCC 38327) TaxID=578462 RepID=A0A0L0S348_ALLM3|nr:hypothetical protein AMAG_02588 [Allomyces macrogynus ATCC 38327]|eukprot:KNE56814.1 hypothetical protein AMAG_02588 [Allomyces macrogynus ATCC 38327]
MSAASATPPRPHRGSASTRDSIHDVGRHAAPTSSDTPPEWTDETAHDAPPLYDFQDASCSLSFAGSDKIRVLDMPTEHIVELCRAMTAAGFPVRRVTPPLEGVSTTGSMALFGADLFAAEFKGYAIQVDGHPWDYDSASRTARLRARRLLASIIRALLRLGWRVASALNYEKRSGDKDVLVLFRGEPWTPNDENDVFALGFDTDDKLVAVDVPLVAIRLIARAIRATWAGGIIRKELLDHSVILKLAGTPWTDKSGSAQRLIHALVAGLASARFMVYCAVDISSASNDNDTLVIIRNPPPL